MAPNDRKRDLIADGMVRVPEAAKFLGMGKSSMYQLMDSGKLPYVKIGASRRIPRKALHEFAANSLVGVW